MICNCGYEFDESATGIYGCPNCEGASVMAELEIIIEESGEGISKPLNPWGKPT